MKRREGQSVERMRRDHRINKLTVLSELIELSLQNIIQRHCVDDEESAIREADHGHVSSDR